MSEMQQLIDDGHEKLLKDTATVDDLRINVQGIGSTTSNPILDTYEGGLRVVHVDGHTEQKSYSGKNKFTYNRPANTTKNGISIVYNEDGSITFNGTCTDWFFVNLNYAGDTKHLPNGKYIFSGGGAANTVYCRLYVDGTKCDSHENKEFEITDSVVKDYVRLEVLNGAVLNNVTLYPMIRPVGTDETYEPYVGGIASPNPSYPQALVSYGGKNLLPNTAVSKIENDVTFTVCDDGTVILNGTASADTALWVNYDCCPNLQRNTEYILSGCPSGGSASTYRLALSQRGADDVYISDINDIGNGTTVVVEDHITRLAAVIWIAAGQVFDNVKFYPMLRKADNPNSEYTPYGAIAIKTIGKNFFDGNEFIGQYNSGDGVWGVVNTRKTTDFIPVHSQTVTFSLNSTTNNLSFININCFDKDKNWLGSRSYLGLAEFSLTDRIKTVTFPDEVYFFRVTCRRYNDNGAVISAYSLVDECLQIEFNSVATSYEPYKEHTEYIYLDEPLRKIGDVADRVIEQNGVFGVERNIKEVVFNGSESWVKANDENGWFQIMLSMDDAPIPVSECLSNRFLYENFGDVYNKKTTAIACDSSARLRLSMSDSNITSLDLFKAWLSENPTTADYILATPTFTPLDTESQKALNRLKTFDTVTYIEVDSVVQPSGMEFEYGLTKVGAQALANEGTINVNAIETRQDIKVLQDGLTTFRLEGTTLYITTK
jgi:hypothetical protein